MLSIEHIRKTLGKEAEELTDEEVTEIRDEYRLLAEIIFEQWSTERNELLHKEMETQRGQQQGKIIKKQKSA